MARATQCFDWSEILLVFTVICLVVTQATGLPREEYLELKKQLKFLNKPAVKSIKTKHGDTFDCVDINKQLALDHPLLKNHTVQMKPSFYPELVENKAPSAAPHIGFKDGGCPRGTVPIRRTEMKDLLRAPSLSKYGDKYINNKISSSQVDVPYHHHALLSLRGDEFYGTRVHINTWNPNVPSGEQFSLAQLWIISDNGDDTNTVEAGWQVYPHKYGDNLARLFVFWTANNYNGKGCYNHDCPGFVQVSNEISPTMVISPSSTYDGPQNEIHLNVFKDQKTGHWWLGYGEKDTWVGYWPNSLFTSLANKVTRVDWGGEVYTPKPGAQPQMGSGHFPNEGYGKAAYIRRIKTVDSSNKLIDAPLGTSPFADQPQCYNVIDEGDGGTDMGRYFFFGGPGLC